jgi:hypothetical protein
LRFNSRGMIADKESLQIDLMHTHDIHIWSHFESSHSFSLDLKHPHLALPRTDETSENPDIVSYVHSNTESQPLLKTTKAVAINSKNGFRKGLKAFPNKLLAFMNPPMWGGLTAVVAGLVPFLRHWLFDDNEWLSPFAQSIVSASSVPI